MKCENYQINKVKKKYSVADIYSSSFDPTMHS